MKKLTLGLVLVFEFFFFSIGLFADVITPSWPPVKLNVKVEGECTASLSWSDYTPDQKTFYNIYVSDTSHKNYQKINDFPYKKAGYYGYGCLEKKDYFFIVKPILQLKPLVEGPQSNEVKVSMSQAHPLPKNYESPISTMGPSSFAITVHHLGVIKALVRVFNMDEKIIRVIKDGDLSEGEETLFWNGKTEIGSPVPPGTYVIEIQKKIGRMVLDETHDVQVPSMPK